MKIAVLGTGWGSRVQLPALCHAGLDELWLWGRDPARTAALAAPLGARAAASVAEACERAELVFVTTPVHRHHDDALAVLRAGRHLICEKPFMLDAAQAAEVAAAAAARPAQFAAVDHELRLLPGRKELRRLLAAGEAGEILAVEIVDRRSARLDPATPWSWWCDAALGGGAWGAVGSHWLDTLRWLFGEIEALNDCDLHAAVKTRRDGEAVKIVTADDYALASGRLRGGIPFSLHFNFAAPGSPEDRLTVRARNGVWRLDGDGRLFAQKTGADPETLLVDAEAPFPGGLMNGYAIGTTLMGKALAAMKECSAASLSTLGLASFADALAVQRLLDAGRRLAAGGRA